MAIGNPITLTSNVASKTISVIATAGQTLFTVTGGYRINQLAVFRNGVRLLDSRDYDARNGSTVTLLSAATVGDALEFQVFDDFRVADAIVSAESEQTIQGNLTVAGILTATDLSVTDLSLRHLKATGISTVSDTTQATSTTTGAFIVSGGVGIAKSLFVGGDMSVAGTLTYEDVTNTETAGITTTGGLVVTGLGATFGSGVGIADSIYHLGDDNTAIRFPAADTFTVTTAGDERIRFTSGPTIGIGDNNPNTGETLVVARSGSTPTIRVNGASSYEAQLKLQADGTATDTQLIAAKTDGSLAFSRWTGSEYAERVRVTSAGDVGIGTASPTSFGPTLQVAGTDPALLLQDTATAVDYFGVNIASGAVNTWFDDASAFVIHTATGLSGSGLVERLRITSGGNVDINGTPPWTVTGGSYRNLSISGADASSSGFLWLGNGAAATNADFDLGRVNFVNGANIVAQIKGTTQTSANDDGRISFFTKATGINISEKLRITSTGRVAIGTISDYSSTVTDAPVYIAMQSNITGIGDHEGGATAGMVRLEDTGSNDGRYHGIELRNKNSGDIRFLNSDRSTSDRGDLILVMPDEDASDGTHLKMRFNSLQSSIQISGKGGATTPNSGEAHTDIYIATKTGMTAVNTALGTEVAGLIRFEDRGTNNNRYHGIELRNRNSGDARILNLDEATTNKSNLIFAIDNGTTVVEALRLNSAGNAVFAGTVSDSKGDLRKIIHKQETSAYTLVAADAGKAIEIQGNLTVPNSVFAAGDAITIINDSSSNKTISKGTGLSYMFNTADGTNANRTLGGRGMATIFFVNSTTCYISGSQLS